jgi:hypothetical protein
LTFFSAATVARMAPCGGAFELLKVGLPFDLCRAIHHRLSGALVTLVVRGRAVRVILHAPGGVAQKSSISTSV